MPKNPPDRAKILFFERNNKIESPIEKSIMISKYFIKDNSSGFLTGDFGKRIYSR